MITYFRNYSRVSVYWQDIIWQASGNGLAQAIGILAMPMLTRLYMPHDFAMQNLFIQVIGFVAVIMTWRYEYFIQLPKDEVDAKALLHTVLLLGCLGLITVTPIVFIFKDLFAIWLGEADLANWLILAPLLAMLTSFSIAMQHRTQRQQDYRKSGLAELINKGGYVASGLLGYWLLPGAAGLLIASVVGPLGKIVWLANLGQRRKLPLNSNVNDHSVITKNAHNLVRMKQIAQTYARMSGSLVFSHIMLTFTGGIPIIFISHMYGAETLGQFVLVVSTLYLPSGLIGSAIGQVYYQRAAELWAKGENFQHLWQVTAKRLLLIGIPLYLGIALISPWAYPLVFGDIWQDAGVYAAYMAVSAFFSFITSPLDRACLIVNAWWYLLAWHTVRAISTGLVVWLAWLNSWNFQTFFTMLIIQMSTIYLIDYWFEWHFASKLPMKRAICE